MSVLKKIYRGVTPEQRVLLDRFRFLVGLLPHITRGPAAREWIPAPYRAALVISADFELGWGYRYGRQATDPQARMHQKAVQTRRNLPDLLKLFDYYETPVTWATVGHLFLERCERKAGMAHQDLPRPPYFENAWWVYRGGDWYDADPCTSLAEDPDWYGADLIRNIMAARVQHEIGCHTFSHIDCSDKTCSPALLTAELTTCRRLAAERGIELKSFVFPGNVPGNLPVIKENGFHSYRLSNPCHLGTPVLDRLGLCAIPGGIFWEITPGWKAKEWEQVLEHCVDLALQKRLVLHLWFHPSCEAVNIHQVFPAVLDYIKSKRPEIWVATMNELAECYTQNEMVSGSAGRWK